jgi:hypothetical protein
MDEVRRLRETAERCYRLMRAILDVNTIKALSALAIESETKAAQREDKLRDTQQRHGDAEADPVLYPDPARGLNSIDPLR